MEINNPIPESSIDEKKLSTWEKPAITELDANYTYGGAGGFCEGSPYYGEISC